MTVQQRTTVQCDLLHSLLILVKYLFKFSFLNKKTNMNRNAFMNLPNKFKMKTSLWGDLHNHGTTSLRLNQNELAKPNPTPTQVNCIGLLRG